MIQINKNWFIDADSYSYILFRKTKRLNKKTGEEEDARMNVTYHATVSDALTCLMRNLQRKLTSESEMNIKEAIEKFKKIEKIVIESSDGKKF